MRNLSPLKLCCLLLVCLLWAPSARSQFSPSLFSNGDSVGDNNDPYIDIVVDSVGQTVLVASFTPNDQCSGFSIYADEIASMATWLAMTQMSVEDLVESWGVHCTDATTHTWDELMPNSTYVIYALAQGNGMRLLYTDTVHTAMTGTYDTSRIAVTVSDITTSSARVTCVPNEATAMFKDMLITQEAFLDWGEDSVVRYLKEDFYTFYATDDHVWENLASGNYYAIAIGTNALGEWGELTKVLFSIAGNGIVAANADDWQVYPNPTTGFVTIGGGSHSEASVEIVDMDGRVVMRGNGSASFDLSQMPVGCYLVRIYNANSCVVRKIVKQ